MKDGCFLVKFFTWLFHVSVFHLRDDSVLDDLVGIWEKINFYFYFKIYEVETNNL
jgi:hypothetical protein